MTVTRSRSGLFLWLLATLGACAPTAPCVEPLSPTGTHYGSSLAEWGVAWWIWSYAVVGCDADPLLDDTGADCAYGQTGDVWFLAGTLLGAPAVERSCTIPAGRAIFFPIINSTIDNGGVPPPEQLTPDEARATALLFASYGHELEVVLDGCSIGGLEQYLAGPTEYTYVVPPGDNVYACGGIDFSGTVEHAQSIGYWMMLPPLPPGRHELYFRGTNDYGTPEPEDDAEVRVTYHLTIGG